MGIHTLSVAKVWLAGYDLSGILNAVALTDGVELADATVLGDTGRRRLAGLRTILAEHQGYFDVTDFDDALFSRIGTADEPMTIAPEDGDEGSVAYTFLSTLAEYTPGGEVGAMFAFGVSAEGSDGGPLVRGTILLNAVKTASGDGTAFQVGAVSTTQKLYAALHVIAASGTLDVKLQSDNVEGFGTPTDQITFAQKSAIGSEWATPVSGPIDDDWWRVNYVIGGGSPSFTFVMVVGIAP